MRAAHWVCLWRRSKIEAVIGFVLHRQAVQHLSRVLKVRRCQQLRHLLRWQQLHNLLPVDGLRLGTDCQSDVQRLYGSQSLLAPMQLNALGSSDAVYALCTTAHAACKRVSRTPKALRHCLLESEALQRRLMSAMLAHRTAQCWRRQVPTLFSGLIV